MQHARDGAAVTRTQLHVSACQGKAFGQLPHEIKVLPLPNPPLSTPRLGTPTPTNVPLVPKPGHAILVTGHDMHDLQLL